MTLVGMRFVGEHSELYCELAQDSIQENSAKPVPAVLFNVKAYRVEPDVLVVNKEFVATKFMNILYLFLLCLTSVPWFVWNVRWPFFIVFALVLFWSLLNTPAFNFLMFTLMVRRLGFKGKVVML